MVRDRGKGVEREIAFPARKFRAAVELEPVKALFHGPQRSLGTGSTAQWAEARAIHWFTPDIPSPLPRFSPFLKHMHDRINMLTVAQPCFESDDFVGT